MNHAGRSQTAHDLDRFRSLLGAVCGDASIKRLAGAHGSVESTEALFHRRVGIGTVMIKDVDVLQAHALEALIEAGQDVLSRAQVSVGAGPHVPSGFGG